MIISQPIFRFVGVVFDGDHDFEGPTHPGVLATKVRYFGVKSAKVPPGQMGTKPAKVGHLLAATLLKSTSEK